MRPTKSDAKFTVATKVGEGKVEVVVNALDQQDEFLNFLDMQAVAVGPDLKVMPVIMRQAAPGRYVGSFDADSAGSYLVNVIPGPAMAPLTTGASVPFSDEYRVRQTNMNMLSQLAKLEPSGGGSEGVITEPLDEQTSEDLVKNTNTYRGGIATSSQYARHLALVFAARFGLFVCRHFCAPCFARLRLSSQMGDEETASRSDSARRRAATKSKPTAQ